MSVMEARLTYLWQPRLIGTADDAEAMVCPWCFYTIDWDKDSLERSEGCHVACPKCAIPSLVPGVPR